MRVSHIVQFKRPETPNAISRMSISMQCSSLEHTRHLETLGYTIVGIWPPLQEYAAIVGEVRGGQC
jgi:hypothetical protein